MAGSLRLGEVTFADFEIPQTLSIGGKQQLVIHSLPGGGRVVDAMGAADAPIRWSGIFSGPQASGRSRILDEMRKSGRQQALTWDSWRYNAVVQEFDFQVANSSWIEYRIQLCVINSASLAPADWLDLAAPPTIAVGSMTSAALEAAIGVAGLALASSGIVQVISAAGTLAQLVTARAYGMTAS